MKLPLDIEICIPENAEVRLLSAMVEDMDLRPLYATYGRIPGEHRAGPDQLLKVMIYADMEGVFSSRDIEDRCRRDTHFMFLLEGKPAPDHSTVSRFRSLHFEPVRQELLSIQVKQLLKLGEISAEQVFIDGSKIEAVSGRYTFVWKKAVSRNQEKMLLKLLELVERIEQEFGVRCTRHRHLKLRRVKQLRRKLKRRQKEEEIIFVSGKGKRKTPLQRALEELGGYLVRWKKYTGQLHTCAERNSFAKTDEDAAFMRMKEDHMRNGQLKPGYNVQIGVDAEYAVGVLLGQQTTDSGLLKPLLVQMEKHLDFSYSKVVCDVGYESEENYVHLRDSGQQAFIKPVNYEKSRTKKHREDISRRENMTCSEKEDVYLCAEGKPLVYEGIRRSKSRTEYQSEKSIYVCHDCSGCGRKPEQQAAGGAQQAH